MRVPFLIVVACSSGLGPSDLIAQAVDFTVDFNRDVRPILSDRCFTCHGPDANARKAKLRLDSFDGATKDRGGYAALVPGNAGASEILKRLQHPNPKKRMPPAKSKLRVSEAEVATIRRWIEQGGRYTQHWSFVQPRRPQPPRVKSATWVKDPLDRFVLARLEQDGLRPSPEASREAWLRRVSFALNGIGPTPAEIAAFLADKSAHAERTQVGRLLASPRFGERMAQDWLDIARYADTYGYQSDVDRRVWPYRDWVIRAFNQNLSYADFLTWQLAGDLLPNATQEQRLATAFNRLHRQTNEGGSVEEEYRVEYVADRTETAATAFLGLTVGCAQCHDHKFDPIEQADFYRLAAFFDNIDESGLYSHFTGATPTPTLLLATKEQQRKIDELSRRVFAAERELRRTRASRTRASRNRAFEAWRKQGSNSTRITISGVVGDYSLDDFEEGLTNRAKPKDKKQRAGVHDGPKLVAGKQGKGILLDGEDNVNFPVGAFRRTDPFTIGLWLRVPKVMQRAVVFHRSRAWTDSGSQGYQMLLEDGRLSASLIHFWPGNAIRVRAVAQLPVDQWVHVTMTYDGSSKASGLRIYQDGARVPVTTVRDNLYKHIRYNHRLTIGQRFRDNGLKGGAVDEFQVFSRELTPLEVREMGARESRPPSRDELLEYYLATVDKEVATARAKLHKLRVDLANAQQVVPEIMAMREMREPRDTFVLARGSYEQRATRVQPGTPKSLPEFSAELPRNRLGLARWLLDPDHPLTSRVAVNRLWYIVFGRGLVPTLENFGSQGDAPSHPLLLDYLAREFVDSGWDVKAMLRRLVLSATFRQASGGTQAKDPQNMLLGRGTRYRLPAEMLRDHALHAGGLLVEKLGGPSVKPYQPPGLWKEKSGRVYRQDKGAGLYRRSLYTFWKRTSPPPSMMIFDAAKRDVCVARRQVTNTPLQALVLLNDPQFVEAARALAVRVMLADGGDDARIRLAFRRLASREPSGEELRVLRGLLQAQRTRFANDPVSAAKLLKVGDSVADAKLGAAEVAAFTVLCSTILNYDAAVMVR